MTLADDGTISSGVLQQIIFVDQYGIRPVCPFFELHAEWTTSGGQRQAGPVTIDVLDQLHKSVTDITWSLDLANLKAYHYTYDQADRINASVVIPGDETRRIELIGSSPANVDQPLIPKGSRVSLGSVQVARPSAAFPEIRIRFYAPAGRIFGPTNLHERIDALPHKPENSEWQGFRLPESQLVLNPKSSWANYVPSGATLGPFRNRDYRNTPAGLLATVIEESTPSGDPVSRSLGLIDDVSDGLITCYLTISGKKFTACARIVVGPPDFSPTSRTPVSLADNLADRQDRASVRSDGWTAEEVKEVVLDLFERAFETSDLMHKDYQNSRSRITNIDEYESRKMTSMLDRDQVEALLWPIPEKAAVTAGRIPALSLSETGTRKHRRQAALEYLEDRFRENPSLFEEWIRRPNEPNPYFDKGMPALMRGSDGRPFHLTRRQWELLRLWIDKLRASAPFSGPVRRGT
jgi:hypothetical protein